MKKIYEAPELTISLFHIQDRIAMDSSDISYQFISQTNERKKSRYDGLEDVVVNVWNK